MNEEKQDSFFNGFIKYFILGGILVFVLGSFIPDLWDKFTNKPESFITEDSSTYISTKRDGWELTLYSSDRPNFEYEFESIKGFNSKDACLSSGVDRTSEGGSFECSYRCKTQSSTFKVDGETIKDETDICEIVCDKNGCRE